MTLGGGSEWLFVEANATTASLLSVAGIGKLYAPKHLSRALDELFPQRVRRDVLTLIVRGLAGAEVVAGVGMVIYTTRVAAAVAAAVLGLGFALFGVIGAVRGSELSCGCLAGVDGRPLGSANIAAGVLLTVVAAANWSMTLPSSLSGRYTTSAVVLLALNGLVLTAWIHRRIALAAFRSPVSPTESAGEGFA